MEVRHSRRGFATFEIFIVSPLILAFGVAVTLILRWTKETTHWTTWLPTILFAIPFAVAYGTIVPLTLYTMVRARLQKQAKRNRDIAVDSNDP